MTLEEARKICEKIVKEHGLYCDYHEERRDGEVKFVSLTLKFKIDPDGVASQRLRGTPQGEKK